MYEIDKDTFVNDYFAPIPNEYTKALELAKHHKIPMKFEETQNSFWNEKTLIDSFGVHGFRDEYIAACGFVILCWDWMFYLVKYLRGKKCLEIMAGSGALSKCLIEKGIDIKPTDNFSWKKQFEQWTDVENIDCIEAIEKYGKDLDYIICSWPYMDDTAHRALIAMRKHCPSHCKMIYIGEGSGGCTANDDFFEEANFLSDDKIKEINNRYVRFWGIHDNIHLIE